MEEFEEIRADMLELVDHSADLLADIPPRHQRSARNLLCYLALRSRDLRPLQARLAAAGLSSLGRAESHVLAAVNAVLLVLQRLAGPRRVPVPPQPVDFAEGQSLLDVNTEAVLGLRPAGRGVAIMVTMPSEAAEDYMLVDQLLHQGMDCVRINCAHDEAGAWTRMLEHLRRAERRQGRSCRVLMDLAGPKVRTGPVEPGPAVVKFGPRRDPLGRVTDPARVWLFAEEQPRPSPTPCDACLPVPAVWMRGLAQGDVLEFADARGARRTLHVVSADADGCWVESRKTCYVTSGTLLHARHRKKGDEERTRVEAAVGTLPPMPLTLTVGVGDELIVTRATVPGRDAVRDQGGHVLTPATIGCTADQVFEDVRTGDPIWFDDGKIGGVVEMREADRFRVRITRARARGARLGSEKGINLPDTALRLPALTDKDRADLAFVCRHADMVALSFVNSAADVGALRSILAPLGDEQPAIVLKIETLRGFSNLPDMLLEAMKSPRCAVMIARGDLAVECGFERMAEVQEEILWLCEAAHVPVIWATQVLETLAKEGMPSRAEVTDAAMAHRAECVMLNKGPYIVQAVKVLDDILRRMHGHQSKKRAMLRELRLVSSFRKERDAVRTATAG
jgi:pyruvate kinase